MIKYYVGDIRREPDTVFVFGSNTQGRHGAGAAKVAHDCFGAVYGQSRGPQGQSYAIVTKNLRNGYRSISPEDIVMQIRILYDYARNHPDLNFKIAYRNVGNTRSLNGYTGQEMMTMFLSAGELPDNIWISEEWWNSGMFN